MQFVAEIIRTTQRKLVSNDQQYELVLRTNDPRILDLGKLEASTLFEVDINLQDNKSGEAQEENVGYQQI